MNSSAAEEVLVPAGEMTIMSTVPTVPAGEVTVSCVAEPTMKFVAALGPKSTALAPIRLVPVRVTLVPPPVGPPDGLTALTVGAAS